MRSSLAGRIIRQPGAAGSLASFHPPKQSPPFGKRTLLAAPGLIRHRKHPRGKVDATAFAAMISGIEAHGISRPEISRYTGLSANTVWRLGSGEVRDPKHSTVEKVRVLHEKVERGIIRPVEWKRR